MSESETEVVVAVVDQVIEVGGPEVGGVVPRRFQIPVADEHLHAAPGESRTLDRLLDRVEEIAVGRRALKRPRDLAQPVRQPELVAAGHHEPASRQLTDHQRFGRARARDPQLFQGCVHGRRHSGNADHQLGLHLGRRVIAENRLQTGKRPRRAAGQLCRTT